MHSNDICIQYNIIPKICQNGVKIAVYNVHTEVVFITSHLISDRRRKMVFYHPGSGGRKVKCE